MDNGLLPVIRPATTADAADIATIYNHYVATTCITFETGAVAADDMARRIGETLAQSLPWLVAQEGGRVIGYAYASPWKSRPAYRHSVESAVYIKDDTLGKGVGAALYAALLAELRSLPVHAVMGGIALPNERSIALHERLGFTKVAHFVQVGFKFDQWIDVGYWQLLL